MSPSQWYFYIAVEERKERTIATLQELAHEYNVTHAPIPLKQPKLALNAQLEQHGAFAEAEGQDTVASLVEAVAREAAIWALKGEDRRRHEERRWPKKRDMREMRKRK